MKQVIFDKESPKGRIVEISAEHAERPPEEVTPEERIEALEAAVLELAGVLFNG